MYNKNNLKNIYEYDPDLIWRINKKVEMYKQYEGFYSGYMYLIEFVDRNFNTLKHRHNHHFWFWKCWWKWI